MITIFSAPKGFDNPHISKIQQNAIRSWLNLGQEVRVILVGDENGLADVSNSLGVLHLKDVRRNEWGTPLVSSIFQLARQASDDPILAYVNADILLLSDFLSEMKSVVSQSDQFLVVGQRWDLDVPDLLTYDQKWEQRLRESIKERGSLHRPAGSDFFVFPRDLFFDMPDFAIGRAGWDNWMIYKALKNRWQVIDATPSLVVVHQNHDYSHLPGGVPHYDLEETKINARLGGGYGNMYMTLDSNFELIDGNIKTARWSRERILRKLERSFRPNDDQHRGLKWRISRRFRRMRRGIL